MFNARKLNDLGQRLVSLSPMILFAAVLTLLPISAWAQCSTKWDANGKLEFIQRGQVYKIQLTLIQKGIVISGTASHFIASEGRQLNGTLDGTLDKDNFSIQIFWNNYQTGVYNGKVLPSGRLDGEAWEKGSPNVRVLWRSEGLLKCKPRPVNGGLFGQLQTFPPPNTAKPQQKPPPAAPPPTPPFIVAGQPVIPPYMPYGIVYLGWEGGPDHPNVEVFVTMDNGTEVPAFSMDQPQQSAVWKQPKMGAIPLQLQRYHHYKFVLKAAGKTLSTAAFVVP